MNLIFVYNKALVQQKNLYPIVFKRSKSKSVRLYQRLEEKLSLHKNVLLGNMFNF